MKVMIQFYYRTIDHQTTKINGNVSPAELFVMIGNADTADYNWFAIQRLCVPS